MCTVPLTQLTLDFHQALDYQLVVSGRAKRLTLRVEPGRGLIVTVPRRFPRRDVPAFVEKNRDWIESTLRDMQQQTPRLYRHWPPRYLALQAVNQLIELEYRSEVNHSAEMQQTPPVTGDHVETRVLAISADLTCKASVASEIALAVRKQAMRVLPPRLSVYARQHVLNYRRVQIRGQRTLWGSYSSNGTLSLNYKLLFLPPELVDYVLLHELAHTKILDHSPRFWQLLESMHPRARQLDAQLTLAGRDVPPWLELAR